jgi:hypothetical protein
VGPFRALDELKDGSPVTPAKTTPGSDGKTAGEAQVAGTGS